ncbi:MAG: hypothetical protein ACM34G_08620, partial [Acidobacteriota bacterium]
MNLILAEQADSLANRAAKPNGSSSAHIANFRLREFSQCFGGPGKLGKNPLAAEQKIHKRRVFRLGRSPSLKMTEEWLMLH